MLLDVPPLPALPPPDVLARVGLRLGFTLGLAFVVQRLLFLLWGRLPTLMARAARDEPAALQRGRTLKHILRHITTIVVSITALFYSLEVLGWDVKPLLAGAGVLGVALGFGAQTLVRDWIAGIQILIDNQFGVGDIIEVNGRPGTVERLTVRVTALRDFNGYLHFVPNGEMKVVTNRSRDWNRLAVDVPVRPGKQLEDAIELCGRVAHAMNADPVWEARLLEPVRVWGIERLAPDSAIIRVVVRARPGDDAPEAARELRVRILHAFTESGIEYPASIVTVATPDDPRSS